MSRVSNHVRASILLARADNNKVQPKKKNKQTASLESFSFSNNATLETVNIASLYRKIFPTSLRKKKNET